jgi:haloalkane dehalogenase
VGASDKPPGYSYTASNQVGDPDAVINQLKLQQVILVAHDASGPSAIDWALAQSERVAGLVLLNTYASAAGGDLAVLDTSSSKHRTPAFAAVRSLDIPSHVSWQVGRFFRDVEVRNKFLPLLYQQFDVDVDFSEQNDASVCSAPAVIPR